jgi:hypothetical protein
LEVVRKIDTNLIKGHVSGVVAILQRELQSKAFDCILVDISEFRTPVIRTSKHFNIEKNTHFSYLSAHLGLQQMQNNSAQAN